MDKIIAAICGVQHIIKRTNVRIKHSIYGNNLQYKDDDLKFINLCYNLRKYSAEFLKMLA